MTKIILSFTVAMVLLLLLLPVYGASTADEFNALRTEVAALNIGFDSYQIGKVLTESQRSIAAKNNIDKTIEGTYKFFDGDLHIVVKADDHTIIGIYKEFKNPSDEEIKAIVGDLMVRFDEPTTAAHEKLIYWAFDKNGRISDEVYSMLKNDGGADIIGLVKFVSSSPIGAAMNNADEKGKSEENQDLSAYVIISSDPLSKLFLAMNR
jgi:hypothetical protein